MASIEKGEVAPDFTLTDYQGNEVQLSQFKGDKPACHYTRHSRCFNRGFF
jgi:peroxiredoxin